MYTICVLLRRTILLLLAIAILAPHTPARAQSDEQEAPAGSTVLLPIIQSGTTDPPQPFPDLPNENGPVFGLLGKLQAAQGQPFSSYLIVADPALENGRRIGLVGETPDIEARITALRDQQTDRQVKVWGAYFTPQNPGDEPQVVASDIIPAETTAPGIALPLAVVEFDLVNLRDGPGNRFDRHGQVTRGETCVIVNRNELETWYFVDCPGNVAGWIDRRLITVHGNTINVPIADENSTLQPPSPEPSPSPTPFPTPMLDPPPTAYWRGEYYANTQLTPPVQFQQNVGEINFNWGSGSPSPNIPYDGFSARFDRTFDFSNGYYRFSAQADDGVRVYLDNELIIDEWHGATERVYVVGRTLNGRHVLKVEYYEASGDASVKLDIEFKGNDPEWAASYFGGVDLAGVPVLEQRESRSDTPLTYNWGSSSPVPGLLSNDFWSARWIGKFKFNNGNYVFRVNADDGVRVFLNDTRVIDDWRDGYREVRNTFIGVGEDEHTIRVEFYDRSGDAQIQLWWYRDSSQQIPQ